MRREGKAEPLLRDLYEFRLLIEPQAAAWMAEHGSDEELDELGDARRQRWRGSSTRTRWPSRT